MFLLAQWRGHHENIVSCSTPSETSTLNRMCRYVNVKNCETDSEDEDNEFLCHVCGQLIVLNSDFKVLDMEKVALNLELIN
jgi:hypothetical protein